MKNIYFVFALLTMASYAHTPLNGHPCHHYEIYASALFWEADEEGVDFVFSNDQGTGSITEGHLKQLSPKWNCGYRIGVAGDVACYNVETDLAWTHFSSHTHKGAAAPANGALYSIWTSPSASITSPTSGRGDWDLCLDTILMDLYNPCFSCGCVEIAPHLGVIIAFISQDLNLNFSGGVSSGSVTEVLDDEIRMSNDYWGLGIRPGISGRWQWNDCLGIYANGAFSIVGGSFHVKQSESVLFDISDTPVEILDIDDRMYRTTILAELGLGIYWETEVLRCRPVSFQLGWEQLYFFGQNQLKRFTNASAPGIYLPISGDLSLQGITLKGSVLF
ncbi:MAG: hypothetical protein H7A37_07925 [Chlamydiales bacterium]|nr:hypothetical protein [Chlamydiia bacterium]MCP5508208.1 hypothetical protein [Chlamydiales bacterium]